MNLRGRKNLAWIQNGLAGAAVLLLVAGCQPAANVKEMQDRNAQLSASLNQAQEKIDSLTAEGQQLRSEIAELERVASVLDSEKTLRVKESSSLRGEVRRFVQQQIDQYKAFLVDSQLLDYVGGELVQRSQVEESPRLLVDLANPMHADGTLTGVKGHFVAAGTFRVKILRQVEDRLVVIWESKPLSVNRAGVSQIDFPVAVGIEKGDVIGYSFMDNAVVSFDTGTGDTRYTSKDVALGQMIKASSLSGEKERRAYALGVYGLLN